MTNRESRRRYQKSRTSRLFVFSEFNHGLRPETIARIFAAAGLEQARQESAARARANELTDGSAEGEVHE